MSDLGRLRAEAEAFLAAYPDVRHLDAFTTDISGNPIGKRYQADAIREIYDSGSSLCAAMHLTDVNGECWDVFGLGFSDGDPDGPTRPIPGTLTPVPWASEPRAQCLVRLYEPDGATPKWFDPRTVLEGVVGRYDAIGLTPVVAIELEFYLTDRRPDGDGRPQPAINPRTGRRIRHGRVFGMDELDAFDEVIGAIEGACKAQGLPVTTICSEYGAGQWEINLRHVEDAVVASDHAVLMRRAVRETARRHGFDATFMSKPFPESSGSSLQVNVSISDGDGNIFDPTRPDGDDRLGHAIAGLQAALAESMAIFAPNLNAFRRFEANQFTPVNVDWGENNRSVAFRIPSSAPADRRIEHRAPGADANPYLATAAVLAGVHHGLTQRLTPTAIEQGNRSEHVADSLPLTLWQALAALERAEVLPEYLGPRYVEAFAAVKQHEFEAFLAEPLAREYDWYL